MDEFSNQVFRKKIPSGKIDCIRLMPNLLLTTALAQQNLRGEEESKANEQVKKTVDSISLAVTEGSIDKLIA